MGERVHPAGISGVKRQFPNHSNGHHLFRHESRRSGGNEGNVLGFQNQTMSNNHLDLAVNTNVAHDSPTSS